MQKIKEIRITSKYIDESHTGRGKKYFSTKTIIPSENGEIDIHFIESVITMLFWTSYPLKEADKIMIEKIYACPNEKIKNIKEHSKNIESVTIHKINAPVNILAGKKYYIENSTKNNQLILKEIKYFGEI